jgi:hypothetical protein
MEKVSARDWYNTHLLERPLAMGMAAAAVFFGLGEMTAQVLEKNKCIAKAVSVKSSKGVTVTTESTKPVEEAKVPNAVQKFSPVRAYRQSLVAALVSTPINHYFLKSVMTCSCLYLSPTNWLIPQGTYPLLHRGVNALLRGSFYSLVVGTLNAMTFVYTVCALKTGSFKKGFSEFKQRIGAV